MSGQLKKMYKFVCILIFKSLWNDAILVNLILVITCISGGNVWGRKIVSFRIHQIIFMPQHWGWAPAMWTNYIFMRYFLASDAKNYTLQLICIYHWFIFKSTLPNINKTSKLSLPWHINHGSVKNTKSRKYKFRLTIFISW